MRKTFCQPFLLLTSPPLFPLLSQSNRQLHPPLEGGFLTPVERGNEEDRVLRVKQAAEGIQNMSGVSLIGLIFIKFKQL